LLTTNCVTSIGSWQKIYKKLVRQMIIVWPAHGHTYIHTYVCSTHVCMYVLQVQYVHNYTHLCMHMYIVFNCFYLVYIFAVARSTTTTKWQPHRQQLHSYNNHNNNKEASKRKANGRKRSAHFVGLLRATERGTSVKLKRNLKKPFCTKYQVYLCYFLVCIGID